MRLVAALLMLAGCGERDQWTVSVATDAPVPQLGDRLLVDILDESGAPAQGESRRQLVVPDPKQWPISFGVVAPDGGGSFLVRARLYRSQLVGGDGLPSGTWLLDGVGRLPASHGNTRVHLTLAMACWNVGARPQDGVSCDPSSGTLQPIATMGSGGDLPAAGSWAPATSCPAAPPSGMTCIPGGAFLLGSTVAYPGESAPQAERVVKLGPFALDNVEYTVGRYRALYQAGKVQGLPVPYDPSTTSSANACTWLDPSVDTNDDWPLNCIGWDDARAACEAEGGRLPTEAEWEWAAGNLTDESLYPWGGAQDICVKANVGRGRTPIEVFANVAENSDCRGGVLPWGLQLGGTPDDVTALGVRSLGGGVHEWTADAFALYTEGCWLDTILVDPRCDTAGAGRDGQHVERGGAWNDIPFLAQVVERTAGSATQPGTGFRCARSF